ncbi:MAG: SelB C-terminal domain-containing protein, partial [Mailhella sp.]|nr:SelB C-terminal domain-containing protein [Mailhella sp.]
GVFGDHCVVRLFSPLRTAAGGVLLNSAPYDVKLRKIPEGLRERLLVLPEADDATRVLTQTEFAGQEGVSWARLAVLTSLEEKRLDKAVQSLAREHKIYCFHKDSRSYVCASALETWKGLFLERAAQFHRQNPLQKGMARGWLFSGVAPAVPSQMGMFVLNQLLREEKLVAEGDILRLAGFAVELQVGEEELARNILEAHRAAPMTPPLLRHVLEAQHVTEKQALPVLGMLRQRGDLVKISEDLYYDAQTMEKIKQDVRGWFEEHSDMTPTDLKELTGLSRKYIIPLLEYFDNSHFTIRVGNERRLRRA